MVYSPTKYRETEGTKVRRLGYDLSVARLEQERLNLGIDKSVSSMNQAEKAQLRYYAMMTQVTQVQGDMARTLQEPANQLRVLKAQVEQCARAFGNLFIPVLNAVLPVAIAVANAIREVINAVASLFGIEMADSVDWGDSFTSGATGTEDMADNLSSAAGSAKELKKYLAGFDELNVLPDQSSGGGGAGSSGTSSGFDIPVLDYDSLSGAVTDKIDKAKKKLQPVVDWIKTNLKEILEYATDIGIVLAAWTISNTVVKGFTLIKNAIQGLVTGGLGTASQVSIGLTLLIASVTIGMKSGYNIGYDGGTAADMVGAILSPLAAALGGGLLGSLIMPGIGTAVGAAIGFTLGLVATVVFAIKGQNAGLIDRFYASEAGQEILELQNSIQGHLDSISNIKIEFDDITGEISSKDLAHLSLARDLLDDIFTLNGRDNLTSQELDILAEKVKFFNSLGLAEIQYEFTETGIKIHSTEEEMENLLDRMEEKIRLETAETALKRKYELLFEAQANLNAALEERRQLAEKNDELLNTTNPQLEQQIENLKAEAKALESLMGEEVMWSKNYSILREKRNQILDQTRELCKTLSENEKGVEANNAKIAELDTQIEAATGTVGEMQASVDSFRKIYNQTAGEVASGASQIAGSAGSIGEAIPSAVLTAIGALSNANWASTGINIGGQISDGISTGIGAKTQSVTDTITSVFNDGAWKNVGEWLGKRVGDGISSGIKSYDFPSVSAKGAGVDTSKLPMFKLRAYASGGLPEQGQMFIANEAGPELVGQIGRKTAVANNDQIVSAVSGGVYKAVLQAMSGGQRGQPQVVSAKVNEKTLFEVVVDQARAETLRTGSNPLLEF